MIDSRPLAGPYLYLCVCVCVCVCALVVVVVVVICSRMLQPDTSWTSPVDRRWAVIEGEV